MAGSNLPPIIIKRVKRGHGDGHGSTTWKIALADFMTAMFIIFLCLWLINQTTPEQRTGIADYFSPASVSRTTSGSGAVLGGQTITVPGVLKSSTSPVSPQKGGGPSTPQEGEGTTQVPGFAGSTDQLRGTKVGGELKGGAGKGQGGTPTQPQPQLEAVKNAIAGIEGLPNAPVTNVTTQWVDEGLRIQLVDSDKRELFVRGSATPLPPTKQLMAQVAKIIEKLPNKIEIAGYTDGVPFGAKGGAYSNWELSADRANASRRLLVESGIADDRIAKVVGRADRELLIPEDPTSPGNRRISITLLRERSPEELAAAQAAKQQAAIDGGGSGGPSRPAPGPAPEGRLIPR